MVLADFPTGTILQLASLQTFLQMPLKDLQEPKSQKALSKVSKMAIREIKVLACDIMATVVRKFDEHVPKEEDDLSLEAILAMPMQRRFSKLYKRANNPYAVFRCSEGPRFYQVCRLIDLHRY